MGTATLAPVRAARDQACVFGLRLQGVDLTNASFRLLVMARADLFDSPVAAVARTGAIGAEGVRLVHVGDGVGYGIVSELEVVLTEATMRGLPKPARVGAGIDLVWLLDIRLPGLIAPLRIYGPFRIHPDGGTDVGGAQTVTVGEQVVQVSVTAGQGPMGFSSGPLGLHSIRGVHFSEDPDERRLIRELLRARLGRRFDVRDFGAACNSDGTRGSGTDDHAAVTLALAEMANGGGTLWLPAMCRIKDHNLVLANAYGVSIEGPGGFMFDTDDVQVMGYLHLLGCTHIAIRGIRLHGPPGVHAMGRFDENGDYIYGTGEPGYDGSACLLTPQNTSDLLVEHIRAQDSPNYVIGGRNVRNATIQHNVLTRGTAGVQIQDGSGNLTIRGNFIADTSDDAIAVGYWGDGNGIVIYDGNFVERVGGRGIVALAGTADVTMIGNTVINTFQAGYLIEANAKIPANRKIGRIRMIGNQSIGAGMYLPNRARAIDVPTGIRITPAGGVIESVKIIGHDARDSRNAHLFCEGAGMIEHLQVIGGRFDGIAARTDPAHPITVADGGGISFAPPDGNCSGFKILNADVVQISGISMRGAYHDGIFVSAAADRAMLADNDIESIDLAGNGNLVGMRVEAIATFAHDNTLSESPESSAVSYIANPVVDQHNIFIPRARFITSDSFAGETAYSPSLGSTQVNPRAWTGSSARRTGGKAQIQGSFGFQLIDLGTSDGDLEVTVTIVDGGGARLVLAPADAGDINSSSLIFLEIRASANAATPSNLIYYYKHPTDPASSGVQRSSQLRGVVPGTYRIRMRRKGNIVQAFIDGAKLGAWGFATGLPAMTHGGIQEGPLGQSTLFDDFRAGETFEAEPEA